MVSASSILATAALATLAVLNIDTHGVAAHGTHQLSDAQVQARHLLAANAKHALGECAQTEAYRKLQVRAAERRQATLHRARRERRLAVSDYLSIDHQSSLDVTTSTDSSVLFGDEVACILEPEVTSGPYYVKGEYIRQDIREDQEGFDLYFDLQVIDVDTCEPVDSIYMDFWHANLTGVYSGVVASDNGAGTADPGNINTTFFRGLYPTDSDGVVQFISKFPGHYTGRTTHLHILGNYGGTVLENGTYSSSNIAHIGQFFFDQDLLTEIYATDLYSVNTYEITTNADDNFLAVASAGDYDSLVEYALLGDSVEDGLFAWISVAVNMSSTYTVSEAATLTASGGVSTTTSAGAGGAGEMGGSGMGDFGGSVGGFGGSAGDFRGSFAGGAAPSGSLTAESSVAGEADESTGVACTVRS